MANPIAVKPVPTVIKVGKTAGIVDVDVRLPCTQSSALPTNLPDPPKSPFKRGTSDLLQGGLWGIKLLKEDLCVHRRMLGGKREDRKVEMDCRNR
jgi:hypothetical protein